MTQGGGGPTKAELRTDLVSLAHNLNNISLQFQTIRQGQPNSNQIASLEQARFQIKEEVVQKEVQLALLEAQTKRARQERGQIGR